MVEEQNRVNSLNKFSPCKSIAIDASNYYNKNLFTMDNEKHQANFDKKTCENEEYVTILSKLNIESFDSENSIEDETREISNYNFTEIKEINNKDSGDSFLLKDEISNISCFSGLSVETCKAKITIKSIEVKGFFP